MKPYGVLIGESPGPNTANSAVDRLMKYAEVEPAGWAGKLIRMNLCDGPWSARRATAGRARAIEYLFNKANCNDGRPLRVLLLGKRIARAWACHGPFGYVTHHYGGQPNLHIAWIPYPSGRNPIYNERKNQLRAKRAVLWALGERAKP
jgi:hypothetical protein